MSRFGELLRAANNLKLLAAIGRSGGDLSSVADLVDNMIQFVEVNSIEFKVISTAEMKPGILRDRTDRFWEFGFKSNTKFAYGVIWRDPLCSCEAQRVSAWGENLLVLSLTLSYTRG